MHRAPTLALSMLAAFCAAAAIPMQSQARALPEDAVEAAASSSATGTSGDSEVLLQVPTGKIRRERARRNPYNPDGSLKRFLFAGGAFTKPLGQTADSYATGFRFQGGAGRNFNRRFALSLQFDWDGLSVRNDVLSRLLPVYQAACGTACTGSNPAEVFGSSHIWSFSVNPAYTFAGNLKRYGYVTAGAGFYHKVTTFSVPAASASCNGCAQSPITAKIDSYTSNAPGWSGGVGFAQQIGHYDAHFYAEARIVFVNNQARPRNTVALGPGFNAFPANSQQTYMVPVTIGIRF